MFSLDLRKKEKEVSMSNNMLYINLHFYPACLHLLVNKGELIRKVFESIAPLLHILNNDCLDYDLSIEFISFSL